MRKIPNKEMANAIRFLSIDAVEEAKSGHPGMPMGIADVATVLFSIHLKFDPKKPDWPNRDRFILSAGHGSMLLYSLLYLTGYEDISLENIKNFRQLNSPTAGHPEYGELKGIETTTGPLGQGLANSVGMAISESHLSKKFGKEVIEHYTFCLVGDGCLMEGISHESASLAGHLKLGKLIVLFDDNKITIDGPTNLSTSDDTTSRFESYGWQVLECDGHNFEDIDNKISLAKSTNDKPTLIKCKTIIGKGSPNRSGTSGIHGAPLGEEEIKKTRENLNWSHDKFVIPNEILSDWKLVSERSTSEVDDWYKRLEKNKIKHDVNNFFNKISLNKLDDIVINFKKNLSENPLNIATRVASQKCLEEIIRNIPNLFGGSADLTGSNNTKIDSHKIYSSHNYLGNYLYYGVREHGMAGIMNGISLYGSLIPYGGTFLVFTDYCRPSIRLSALMKLRVIYVMTHDSIGLGEDGPTHQPIEHLDSLRLIPNLNVFRPADIIETMECWEIALKSKNTPSVIVLSRQKLPQLRNDLEFRSNKSSNGAYVIFGDKMRNNNVVLFSSGSEVGISIEAAKDLEKMGYSTIVYSVPCLNIFIKKETQLIKTLIKNSKTIIFTEATILPICKDFYNEKMHFVGMNSFGKSGPGDELFEYFRITKERIIEIVSKNTDDI